MSLVSKLLGTVAGPVFEVIDQQDATLQARMRVILAEAGGESWAQRNWRPILMLVIVAIVANNYLLAPYLGAVFGTGLSLELPERLWDLMTLGVGGYIAGRSVEKTAERIKGKRGSFLDEVAK